MKKYQQVASFDVDLGVAGQEKNVLRAAFSGSRVRVVAELLAGSWSSVSFAVKYRSGLASPANFTGTLALSSSVLAVQFVVADEKVFDELAIVQSNTSSGAWVRIVVSEEVDDGGGGSVVVNTGPSDGDKGDITVSSTGAVYTIDNDAVTYAKMQNVSATDKVLGRATAGAGDVEEIACTAAGRALIDDADAAAQRVTLGVGTLLSVQTGGSTVSNPGAGVETAMSLTLVIPANYFTVGRALRVTADMTAAGAGANTTTFKLKAGSVVMSDCGAVTHTATTATQWRFEWVVVCTATGGSGTLLTSCTNNERNGNGVGQILQQSATVDTTGSITLQMSVTFSQTSATLAATQKLFMVEGLN